MFLIGPLKNGGQWIIGLLKLEKVLELMVVLERKKGPGNNTIDVSDVDVYLNKIQQAGGKIVMPKTALPRVGYLAYLKDPQGNVFGIMKNDPNASEKI